MKCPSCGDEMLYDSSLDKLLCKSCGKTMDVDTADSHRNSDWNSNTNIFKCSSCGAELITDNVTAATFCSFCGGSTIISSRLENNLEPDKIIPFKIDKQTAKQAFKKWCKNGLVTPKDFTNADRIEEMTGIYVPFWLYDCSANANVEAECTKVRIYTVGDTEYTETSHYKVYRDLDADYLKVPADASKNMDDCLMDNLEPYNYIELEQFKIPYLSGYFAEKYSYSDKDIFSRVKNRVDRYIEDYVMSTISGYSSVMVMSKNISSHKIKADYVLLPVWILNYNYHGQKYTFAMNGQTGKITGKPPISTGKVVLWATTISAVTFIILCLLGVMVL